MKSWEEHNVPDAASFYPKGKTWIYSEEVSNQPKLKDDRRNNQLLLFLK